MKVHLIVTIALLGASCGPSDERTLGRASKSPDPCIVMISYHRKDDSFLSSASHMPARLMTPECEAKRP